MQKRRTGQEGPAELTLCLAMGRWFTADSWACVPSSTSIARRYQTFSAARWSTMFVKATGSWATSLPASMKCLASRRCRTGWEAQRRSLRSCRGNLCPPASTSPFPRCAWLLVRLSCTVRAASSRSTAPPRTSCGTWLWPRPNSGDPLQVRRCTGSARRGRAGSGCRRLRQASRTLPLVSCGTGAGTHSLRCVVACLCPSGLLRHARQSWSTRASFATVCARTFWMRRTIHATMRAMRHGFSCRPSRTM
mmetsp:Transcript_103500/g.292637  ORF Transcript_103500/g.292637 Transcript_103500/m.292637 type:complete len:249 (+) Transcript_103500:2801-3547(+)